MPKLVWRVKLVAELEPGLTTEVEVARLEHDEQTGLADLGLRLAEAKQLTAALQAEMVPAKSFAVLDLEAATVAPELAYVTARYAAPAPFGKVADLLSELLPISGVRNAGSVRNRTLRVGEAVVQPHLAETASPTTRRLSNLSSSGSMAATSAVGTGNRSVTSRWWQAR